MKKISSSIGIILLMFAVMSCGLINRFTPVGEGMNRTSELWPDVPKMDTLAPSDMEMPLMIKVVIRTALNNLWRLNKEGEDKTPATGDWIVFTTTGTPSDVESFYTNARMTSFGNWEASKKSTCMDGKENGFNGVLCVFEKFADKKQIGLAIISVQDEKTKQTSVFFLRVEKPATDEEIKRSSALVPSQPKNEPIKKLSGSAPYGVESRPEPTGTDLDKLLPKQVDGYTRVSLEKSEQRGTAPTSIEVDGNGVYATYQKADREVFMEFSIASSAENAQSNWDVVVGDANAGVWPTDPKFGSFRTEPSYLKVVNDEDAFFAWTRGAYFFSADAKGGQADLDAFMNAFPY
jgi:hypothetical protein